MKYTLKVFRGSGTPANSAVVYLTKGKQGGYFGMFYNHREIMATERHNAYSGHYSQYQELLYKICGVFLYSNYSHYNIPNTFDNLWAAIRDVVNGVVNQVEFKI
jgi:hypothetical protein